MARRPKLACLAVCSPGLEPLVHDELVALGISTAPAVRGGVPFRANARQLYAANMWSRVSTRVLVRLGGFQARNFADLERNAAAIDWHDVVRLRNGVRFRVKSTRSRLYHTGAIAQRLAASIGTHITDDEQAPSIVVRVDDDRFTISADASGESLSRRGWRLDGAKAPARETLAAAMVQASGWDGAAPLIDPFCGSGTIVIEAVLRARDLAPGLARSFAFERWPAFEPGSWASVRGEARDRAEQGANAGPLVIGRDRDAGAVDAALANAERAGVDEHIRFEQAPLSTLESIGVDVGWLVTNPPYGKRIGDSGRDLRNLYARFGQVARDRFGGWSVGMLVADRALAGHTGLALTERFRTDNGGVPVAFVQVPGRT